MNQKMSRKLLLFLFMATIALVFGNSFHVPGALSSKVAKSPAPKYIFIFLADGAGIAHLELARLYNRYIYHQGLTISDKIMKEGTLGLLTTHSADFLVTDSGAAGTAMANGCKARNQQIGICANGKTPKTVLEIAKKKGARIGLVTNSTIYDASPAAFATHVPNRELHSLIVDQYLNLEPELLLGGGRDQFLPRTQKGSKRKDKRDMIALFQRKGYAYASNKEELKNINGPKVLGLFSLKEMSYEIDRDKKMEPSLTDMTEAAIRILQRGNPRGFVVFIENENNDTAAHRNDVIPLIQDFREFDRAVGLAYKFYQKHSRQTLLLVTADHETGGLSVTKGASMQDLRDLQKATVKREKHKPNSYPKRAAAAIRAIVAHNPYVSWGSTGHTNQPVFVGALGVGAEKFRGYQDNTQFAEHLSTLIQGHMTH
ncbi:MAG: alkaline phosphatase [Candidatus Binatia bacterium]